MFKKLFPVFVLLAVALSACGGPVATATPSNPDDNPGAATPYPYPMPITSPNTGDNPSSEPYPAPYEPQPGDPGERGNVFPDLENSEMLQLESFPIQVTLILRGDLPTPCNQFRAIVTRDEAAKRVDVEAYSVVFGGQACADVLQPFETPISLGSFSEKYGVYVNGELMGEISP